MRWPVGTLLICIDDKHNRHEDILSGALIEGNYYTLRGWYEDDSIYVNEILCRSDELGEYSFYARRFRIAETNIREVVQARQEEPVQV